MADRVTGDDDASPADLRLSVNLNSYPELYADMVEHIEQTPEIETRSQFVRAAIRKELDRTYR